MKNLESIKKKIAELKPFLMEKYYISSIGLFGSIVRNDFSAQSDIDIIVDFKKPIGIEFVDLAEYLEKSLKNPVDLVSQNGIKPQYFNSFKEDIIYV